MNEEARRKTERRADRVQRLVPALVVLAILIALGGAFYARSGSDASHDVRASANASECRSEINDARNVVKERLSVAEVRRDNLQGDVLKLFLDGDSTGARALAVGYGELRDDAKVAADAVDKLPTLSAVADHGGVIDGRHYGPCPRTG